MTVLTCKQISRDVSGQSILSNIDLNIGLGEFVTLLGPSGCGKTSLLRIIAGLDQPNGGSVFMGSRDITELAPQDRPIHMVFQHYALFPHLSVFENVAFGLRCRGVRKIEIKKRVETVLKQVRMDSMAGRYSHQLSGGQKQRVALARSLVLKPDLLLLDEPMSALDSQLKKQMHLELKRLQGELGFACLLVTHDHEEALSLSDRLVVMREGRIIQVGTPRDVYENPGHLFVATFVGESNLLPVHIQSSTEKDVILQYGREIIRIFSDQVWPEGGALHLLLRPEDIQAWALNELPAKARNKLKGKITSVIYKGATVDLWVRSETGQLIAVTEFFDDNDDTLDYRVGESVWLTWHDGWEKLLL